MGSPGHSSRAEQIEIERKLLAALCQHDLNAVNHAAILHSLENHRFTESDHEVVYRALTAIFSAGRTNSLETLTQAVTRMGFPDMDLRELFTESPPTPDEIASLLACL
jgi:replicative DNA helicase